MLIHFRREGKVHRTLCGQRWHPGFRPRVWRREWSEPFAIQEEMPEQAGDRRPHWCPDCMKAVVSAADLAKRKAGRPELKVEESFAPETDR